MTLPQIVLRAGLFPAYMRVVGEGYLAKAGPRASILCPLKKCGIFSGPLNRDPEPPAVQVFYSLSA